MQFSRLSRHGAWLAGKQRNRETGDYKSFVGPAALYDRVGAMQFYLLTYFGLRKEHYLLDIGCGSLRAGRLLIPYLLPGRYCGIEPEAWLVETGIARELGEETSRINQPRFSSDPNFTLSVFGSRFDFILAHSIFSHASLHQIRRCLAEARDVMGPSSIFLATFVQGKRCYQGNEWVHCARYTWEKMRHLAREADLLCRLVDWHHPVGQRWMMLRRGAR